MARVAETHATWWQPMELQQASLCSSVAGYGSQSHGYSSSAHSGGHQHDHLYQDHQLQLLQRRQQRRYCSLPEAGYNPRGAVRYAQQHPPSAEPLVPVPLCIVIS